MSITDVPLPGWCFIEAFSPRFAEFTSQPSLAGEERETPRPRCRERGDGPSRAHSPAGQADPPGTCSTSCWPPWFPLDTQHRESKHVLTVGTWEHDAGFSHCFFNPTADAVTAPPTASVPSMDTAGPQVKPGERVCWKGWERCPPSVRVSRVWWTSPCSQKVAASQVGAWELHQ